MQFPRLEKLQSFQRRDAGITLVEVLIGVILAGIVGTAVLGIFVRSAQSIDSSQKNNYASGSASSTMSYLMNTINTSLKPFHKFYVFPHPNQIIRSGVAPTVRYQLAANNDTEATFWATTKDFGVVLVHIYVDDKHRLVRDYIPCGDICGTQDAFPDPPLQQKIMAENVVTPAAGERPIFSWYAAGSTTRLVPTATQSVVADYDKIAAVYISLSTKVGDKARPMTVENFQIFPAAALSVNSPVRWATTPIPSETTAGNGSGSTPGTLGPAPSAKVTVSSDPSTWPTIPPVSGFTPAPQPSITGIV